MPTQSRNGNTYPELPIIIGKLAHEAPVVGSQLKGFEPGKLVVLDSLAFSAYFPETNHKHPNRPMKPAKNQLERGEFDHLKKGRIYKVSFRGNLLRAVRLYKTPLAFRENQIGVVRAGAMVIYLEIVQAAPNTVFYYPNVFHKIVVDDQVGYISCTNIGLRLKRITSRMLRRMEAKNERQTPQP